MSGALHLVARVGGRGILFDVTCVDSVVDLGGVVPVPGAGRAVLGLSAMRSRVATVLDTRHLLGLGEEVSEREEGGSARAVVTTVDGHLYAFSVDTLEDVGEMTLVPLPSGVLRGPEWRAVTAMAQPEGETLLALDVDRLVQMVDALT